MRPTSWPGLTETSAKIAAKSAIQQKLTLLTLEEFANHQKQGIDFSLKSVAVFPDAELLAADLQSDPASADLAAEMASETEPVMETPSRHKSGGVEVGGLPPEAKWIVHVV